MKIFLDDVRDIPDDSWVIVRSYYDFGKLIKGTSDVITEISFDHDLGMDSSNALAPTGMDAAKWLVDYIYYQDQRIGEMLEKVVVHSSNPPGAANIAGYFKSAKKHGIFNDNLEIIVQPR